MKILILTLHDDCCGPMATAFLRDYSQKLEVVSVGINPSDTIQPLVITAMKESLVDLSEMRPNGFGDIGLCAFDYVLAIGVAEDFTQIDAARTISLNPEIVAIDMESMRLLRDWIKNEVFIIFKSCFHR